MSLSHAEYREACRTHALTLSVATTGSATLAATATGYTRSTGSFLDDGFRVGMEVTPTGFTTTTAVTITALTATVMTTTGTRTVQSSAAARTLAVGLPLTRAWENLGMTPVLRVPYVAERYFPGTVVQDTVGPLAYLEVSALYQLDFHVPSETGPAALDRYADAATVLFTPRQTLTADDATVIRVRTTPGPSRSAISPSPTPGFGVVSVSFPIVVRLPNTV